MNEYGSVSTRALERVTDGMTVVDSAGEKVGKVEYVQMGDPGAATTQGNELERPAGGILGGIAMALGGDDREPDVPEPLRSRLLLSGFIKVDGPGFTDTDRYVQGDMVRSVSDDTVTLSVRKDQLAKEA